MRRPFRHRRQQRHRRGTAADDQHAFVGVIELFRPLLGMNHGTLEIGYAREVGRVAALVAVVAAAHEEKVAGELLGAIGAVHLERPGRRGRVPAGGAQAVVESDMRKDVVLLRRFPHVLPDGRSVGDGLRIPPGFEVVAEGVHVAVGADPRIAEQVPGPSDGIARFENGKRLSGTLFPKMTGSSDAGNTRSHDDHVETLHVEAHLNAAAGSMPTLMGESQRGRIVPLARLICTPTFQTAGAVAFLTTSR